MPGEHTEKEVVGVGTWSADLEDLEQVEELAVDVADDSHGRLDMDNIALFHEQLFCLCANRLNHRLCKQLLLIESGNTFVEVDAGLQTSALIAHTHSQTAQGEARRGAAYKGDRALLLQVCAVLGRNYQGSKCASEDLALSHMVRKGETI